MYKYKDDPHVGRPAIWDRSDDEETESDEEKSESDDEESSLIRVSGKMKVKNLTKKAKEE